MSTVTLRAWQVPSVGGALLRAATDRRLLRASPGLRFAKLLGTGSGDSFTPRDADLHRWALLTVHDDGPTAEAFARSRTVRGWDGAAHERLVVGLRPLTARGRWSRTEPFVPGPATDGGGHAGPVAAITRARLRPTRTLSFWRAVPPVVADLRGAEGMRMAIGIGEAPVGLQGTFSLWDSSAALVDFAYRSTAHRRAVEQTAPQRWYAEELFARFAVEHVRGTWQGRTP